VFWVRASNVARFEQSFRNIAEHLKIADRNQADNNIFELVHDWMLGCETQWLLVLDGMDDASFLFDNRAGGQGDSVWHGSTQELHKYLPKCEKGSILVTTQNRCEALRLVEQPNVVTLGGLDKEDAITLLQKKAGTHGTDADLAELAEALYYMPVAITLATASISKETNPSVASYTDTFRPKMQSALLDHELSEDPEKTTFGKRSRLSSRPV